MSIEEKNRLEQFVDDSNIELKQLEEKIKGFNLFETLGIVHKEIRHSNVLGWLLDPSGTHDLGDCFLKLFLKTAVQLGNLSTLDSGIGIIEADTWDFKHLQVIRERYRNIDIFLKDDKNRFLAVIENKIFADEGTDQLSKYYSAANTKEFDGFKKMFVFLTPNGNLPKKKQDREVYIPISYEKLYQLIDQILENYESSLSNEVSVFLKQYNQTLRRHIVSDSDIKELVQQIYRKHKAALDLIFEYKPDLQGEIRSVIEKILDDYCLIHDVHTKKFVRFSTSPLEQHPQLKQGRSWTRTNRMLLFEFQNEPGSLTLKLILGSGDDQVRNKIYKAAQLHPSVFKGAGNKFEQQWVVLYQKSFLNPVDYETMTWEKMNTQIDERFSEFFRNDYHDIIKILSKALATN